MAPLTRQPGEQRWQIGLCPRCLSPNKYDDAGQHLRKNWCDNCGFTYTLALQEDTDEPAWSRAARARRLQLFGAANQP